tara:strand:- start:46 stop:234 length:189 start_codon:yes stop_codon:yes gene_type:complete
MTELGTKLLKKRYQIKSRWYYIFWGIATVSVVAGQIYVGTGYRQMANTVEEFRNAYISRNKY